MARNQRQELEALLDESRDLQKEVRRCQHELNRFELILAAQFAAGEISEFTYQLKCQQVSRSRQTINEALQKLKAQRNRILSMLEDYW